MMVMELMIACVFGARGERDPFDLEFELATLPLSLGCVLVCVKGMYLYRPIH